MNVYQLIQIYAVQIAVIVSGTWEPSSDPVWVHVDRDPWKSWKYDARSDFDFEFTEDAIIERSNSNHRALIRSAEPVGAPYMFECTVQHHDNDDDRIGVIFGYASEHEHYRFSLDNRSRNNKGQDDLRKHGLVLVRADHAGESIVQSQESVLWPHGAALEFRVEHGRERIRVSVRFGDEVHDMEIESPPAEFSRYHVGVWNQSQPIKVTRLKVTTIEAELTIRPPQGTPTSVSAVFPEATRESGGRVFLLASRRPGEDLPESVGDVRMIGSEPRIEWHDSLAHNLVLATASIPSSQAHFSEKVFEPILNYVKRIQIAETPPTAESDAMLMSEWVVQAVIVTDEYDKTFRTPCRRIQASSEVTELFP